MRLIKLLFGIGLLVYFCYAVISRIPAGWGAHYLLQAVGNLQLSGVTGTLWQGRAADAQITIDGKTIGLGQTQWELQPAALLQTKACAQIDSELLSGHVCRNANGLNTLSRVMVDQLPASILNDAMGAQLGGTGDITVSEFQVRDNGDIQRLNGSLTWNNARINVGTGWFTLGSFGVALSENGNGGLFADITDIEGEFDVDVRGDIKLHEMPRMNGVIIPSNNAPDPIRQALSIFAEPRDEGGFIVTWPIGG